MCKRNNKGSEKMTSKELEIYIISECGKSHEILNDRRDRRAALMTVAIIVFILLFIFASGLGIGYMLHALLG